MNKSILKILVAITILLSIATSVAQIKNAKTEQVKIYGNCEICKNVIEKAGNLKKEAKVGWNADSKMATLTYDPTKTNQEAILKRIALAGYDSDTFLAPKSTYDNLPGCCQYERSPLASKGEIISNKTEEKKELPVETQTNQLSPIFENYFAIKDALVKTDGKSASENAKELLSAINAVTMETLKMNEHMVWMKVVDKLKEDASNISASQDAKKQRDFFDTLSANIYELIKVSKQDTPTYFQHCPMANDGKGADWLSKDNTIKNPYYGSMMLSCGKTVETIK